jgi:hypothetical protein
MVQKDKVIGSACYPSQSINIDPSASPHDWIMQAYFHELTHWILHVMSHPLQNDEAFVDMFAHLLYQALKSGEEPAPPIELMKNLYDGIGYLKQLADSKESHDQADRLLKLIKEAGY